MTLTTNQRHNAKALALCALYAFVLLFFLSPDSYLRDMFYRYDSAWFFMCGKAWMSGLTPYVDFADSKGPLLWLIYGIGYLLNHHSYVGVFWMSVLFYTATLYIAYKLCRLFLNPRPAALCVALLPLALFFYQIHVEVRAEDFCYPFIMLALYCLCRLMQPVDERQRKTIFYLNIGLGVAFMCTLLIKWNVAGMIGSTMLVSLLLTIKRKSVIVSLCGMATGAAAIGLPFLIYFLCFADINAFIYEYFLYTFRTMEGKDNALEVLTFGRLILIKEQITIILFLGLALFCWRNKRYSWLIFCFLVFRYGMGLAVLKYYYSILMPYFIFLPIVVMGEVQKKWSHAPMRLAPCVCVLASIGVITLNIKSINSTFLHVEEDRASYYAGAYVMSQLEKPKLMNFNLEIGMGTSVEALPSCQHWSRQLGAPAETIEERERELESRKADFVLVSDHLHPTENFEETCNRVKAQGYVPYVDVHMVHFNDEQILRLFGRPGLQLPPEDFYVSQWDVWLKRNIFGI